MSSKLSAIILAGGEGKRMKSDKPKTLCEVLGKPMLEWVLNSLKNASVDNICIVTGYKKEQIEQYIETLSYPVQTAFQSERLGTGHAVMQAKDFLKENDGDVLILNGDAPFMDSQTINDALKEHTSSQSIATVISANVPDSTGYGRIVRNKDSNALERIVEQKDASPEEIEIKEVNSGAYWFNSSKLLNVLDNIKNNNNSGEYYLPDALKLLLESGQKVSAFAASSADTVLGANDPEQLEELNEIAKTKI